MKPFLSFANSKVLGNPLLFFTYLVVSPLAKFLVLANFTPKMVTHLSNFSFGISLYFFLDNNALAFSLLLVVSFVFDVADGMVARLTNSSSALGSFYDHSSDDLKLALLLFVVGFHHDTSIIWILVFIASGSILLVSSNGYAHSLKDSLNRIASQPLADTNEDFVYSFWPKRLVRGVLRSLVRLDGNFMYYFFLLSPDKIYITEIVLSLIVFVVFINLLYGYFKLYMQAKVIDKRQLRWK